jgi:hypothetical protein
LYTFVDTRKDEHIPDNRIISKHMDRLVAVGEELACDEAGVSLGVGGYRISRSIRFKFFASTQTLLYFAHKELKEHHPFQKTIKIMEK